MLRAGDITDMVLDLGIQSPRIVGRDEWAGKRVYVLSFGPPAYRQTLIIEPSWDMNDVRTHLEASRAPAVAEAAKLPPKAEPQPAATPALLTAIPKTKGKRKSNAAA